VGEENSHPRQIIRHREAYNRLCKYLSLQRIYNFPGSALSMRSQYFPFSLTRNIPCRLVNTVNSALTRGMTHIISKLSSLPLSPRTSSRVLAPEDFHCPEELTRICPLSETVKNIFPSKITAGSKLQVERTMQKANSSPDGRIFYGCSQFSPNLIGNTPYNKPLREVFQQTAFNSISTRTP